MRLAERDPASTPLRGHRRRDDAWLVWAAVFFAAAVVIHNSDHLRRGADAVKRDVFWLGAAAIVLEVAVVVLVCQRHRLAPLATATAGFALTAGYVVVHFLPARPWLSDSFTGAADVSPFSLVAASVEVLASATLGAVGLAVLRRRGGPAAVALPNPGQTTLGRAVRHPLVLVFGSSQAATLAISFVQL